MAEEARPNVSYPFDGQPPDNLPIVEEPISLVSPWVTFDATPILLNQLDLSTSLESLDDDDFVASIFRTE